MSGILLDTNVVSEATRPIPDEKVLAFLAAPQSFWLSAIVVHELEYGIQKMPSGRRRDHLAAAIRSFIADASDHVLPIGQAESVCAAEFRVLARQSGRALTISDSLVAATASVNHLTLATRDTNDLTGLDLRVINPWE
ncbi:PIN domain-containing protein [Candidatus Poriferisodalis sp.]|uniref:PIN domain-containing protein n=1 Tax=Candidatus Poriferisodalis sp. TaxID=3101277 RepID=UPI003B58E6DA